MLLVAKENPFVKKEIVLLGMLVSAGEDTAHITLPVLLRGFLIDCLFEHLRDQHILSKVLALEYLKSSFRSKAVRGVVLKRAGDAALLLAGLFPEVATRRNVMPTYFRHMGQASYLSLAAHWYSGTMPERGRLYNEVAHGFVYLERVLDKARVKDSDVWVSVQKFFEGIKELEEKDELPSHLH